MRPGRRGWVGIALAILLIALFVKMCVRIVPGDGPAPAPALVRAPVERPAAAETGSLLIPVEGVPPSALTDTFTQARASGTRPHDAIDIMAARGRAVLAAADGRRIYYYAHLDAYAPGLAEGQKVWRAQKIATVGSTGNADPAAPHLHFAVHEMAPGEPWYGGRAINPYPLLAWPLK